MSWTKERTTLLEKRWTEGKSAAEIAKELGGVTRNAVIGKAHRMGLSGRPSPIKKATAKKKAAPKKKAAAAKKAPAKKPTQKKKKTEEPKQTPLPKSIKPIPAGPKKKKKERPKSENLGILDLTDRICKWPIGDPQSAEFHFCGDDVHPGRPYCVSHCTEAYQALQKKAAAAKKAALKKEEKAKAKREKDAAEEDEDDEDIDLDDLDDLDVDNIDNADDDDDDDDLVGVAD